MALTDQWFAKYGELEWKILAECLSNMKLYSDGSRHGFEHTFELAQPVGLFTVIWSWDEDYLAESLSDLTIYMACYTTAHLLHNGDS